VEYFGYFEDKEAYDSQEEMDYIPGLDDGEWGYDEDMCGEEDFA